MLYTENSLTILFESSTLDWTTPMREVIVKSMKVGVFFYVKNEKNIYP